MLISQKVYHLKSRILITNLFLIFQSIGDTKKLVATVDEVLEHVKLVSEIIE